jgi:hypothetical protein
VCWRSRRRANKLDVLSDTIQPFLTFSEIYVEALKSLRAEIAVASKPVAAGPPIAM